MQEINDGEYPNKDLIVDFVKEIPILESNVELEKIVEFYLDNYVMQKSYIGDAVHLAYASYYNIEYLVT